MTIEVKFFASLKERLNLGSISLDIEPQTTVENVWNMATKEAEQPDNLLCAVNHQHVSLDYVINDGDEVAFFPPVTGG